MPTRAPLNALITGSTSGIGLAVAESFAKAGMNICLNGFGEPKEIEAIRARLAAEYGIKVVYHGADLSKASEIKALTDFAKNELGPIDVLMNNAGIQYVAPIEDFPDEKWDAILAVNLSSAFHTIKALLPAMKARGFGRIINLASAHGLVASPFKSAYVAAKHGILGLTKTVALEAAETGVTVNAICPGYVLTPLVEKQIPDTAKARGISTEAVVRDVLLQAQPTKRFVEAEDIGAMAVFLCSQAGRSITGTHFSMDGGWTAK